MVQQPLRIQGRKGIKELIETVCKAHTAITQFKTGLNLLEDDTDSLYPLSFLESDFSSRTEGNLEVYNLVLCIADYLNDDASEEEVEDALSKTDEILSEIHLRLEQINNQKLTVSDLSKQSFRDYDNDNVCVTRGEFTLSTPRYTAKTSNPFDKIELSNPTICTPVTVVNPNNDTTTQVGAGKTYVVPTFIKPIVVNPNNGETIELTEGVTYEVPEVIIPEFRPVTVHDNNTEILLNEGETYEVVRLPVTVINKGEELYFNNGDIYEVPAYIKPIVVNKGVTTELEEGQTLNIPAFIKPIVVNKGVTTELEEGETLNIPAFIKPTVTEKGVVTELEEGGTYNVVHTPVTITNRFGDITTLEDGETYTERPIKRPAVDTRFGETILLDEGTIYTEQPITKSKIINLNDNSETLLNEGEQFTIPLILDEIDTVFNYGIDADNTITAIVTEAISYVNTTSINTTSVVYKVNDVVVTLPFSVVINDTITIDVVRTDVAVAATVTLKNY